MKRLFSIALLAALPVVALAAKDELSKYAGVYKGETRAKGETRRQSTEGPYAIRHHTITLSLGRDGTATLTQSPDGTHEITSFAHWSHDGDTIKLNFDPVDQQPTPAPMSFRLDHKALTPVVWNHDLWRKLPPPTLHRSREGVGKEDED
jgi:hypothetical protein